jgi:methylaspartate mutase epsilon subunit
MLKDQKMMVTPDLKLEMDIILAETRQILDRVFRLGEGDLALGTVRAFQAGVIDVPFAPSIFNAGKLLPARDNNGAVRLLDTGNLPFDDDLKAFHHDKMGERAKFENRKIGFQMVIDDVYAISKGCLVGRPR